MTTIPEVRLNEFERRLRALEAELGELRALASTSASEARKEREAYGPAAVSGAPSVPPPPSPEAPLPAPVDFPPPRPFELAPRRPRLQLADLLGAKALSWAGGVVTLLGIVFFFILAVDRGWIGPEARVAFGGAASLVAGLAGAYLHRRFGHIYAALAAVGTGIAGAYATLLAAAALYGFVSHPVALLLAAVVAALGLALSLLWSSQLVAGIGLIGALLIPALLALDGGLSRLGASFVAVVLAAVAVVGIERRWRPLLALGGIAGGAQVVAYIAVDHSPRPGTIVLAALFWALLLATGVAYELRARPPALSGFSSSFLLGSAAFSLYACWLLFGGLEQGTALLLFALVHGLLGTVLFRSRRWRDLSSLLFALALAVGAVGVANLVSGGTLTEIWAAEAAVLAWLSRRLREIRFQLGALVYLGVAAVHALLFEAAPAHLFAFSADPASAIPSVVALAAASAIVAWRASEWKGAAVGERGIFGLLAPLLQALREHQSWLRSAAAGAAGVLIVYALSLGVLEIFQLTEGGLSGFHHGQVVVSALWGIVGLLVLTASLRRRIELLEQGSLAWLLAALAKVLVFDTGELDPTLRSASFLALAGSLFLAAFALQRLASRNLRRDLVTLAAVSASLALTLSAVITLAEGSLWGADLRGIALLGVAALYGGFAALALRPRRDYSTLLWAIALAVAATAEGLLLGGQWLVAVWAASSALLAWLAVGAKDRRLQLGSLFYLLAALAAMLVRAAPPSDLFEASTHPGLGVPSVLCVLAAAVVVSFVAGRSAAGAFDRVDRLLERAQRGLRSVALWGVGTLGIYALSLAVLELFELLRPGSLESSFQSGHTAVSAVWGTLGLALLTLGLKRRARPLQLGGFALFGASLAKLFLYDLAQLSSITRALSFLAVGAVLLAAGFFYQRLSAQAGRRGQGPIVHQD